MAVEFLSIGIPTRNRAGYLRDVLEAFERQIQQAAVPLDAVRLYVSDNASTDQTPEVVKEFAARLPHLSYSRNPENIGADPNFQKCLRLARGRFCWLFGDDDLLSPGALEYILRTLRAQETGLSLLLSLDTNYPAKLKRPARFPTFRDFAAECARTNLHLLAEHSLITSNIYRPELFDHAFSEARRNTFYGHMYGLVHGLIKSGGAVYLTDFPVFTVRARRAAAVDGEWPEIIEKAWMEYLAWMKQVLDLPALDPTAIVGQARAALWRKIRRNPFKYVWNNLPALVQPKAYAWFFRRVLYMNRRKR